MPLRPLSALEVRVLGTLMEKARTVPDSYPMTLNALIGGCNQKTSRHPLMQVSDTEVQSALDAMKRVSLVFETSGGRVSRYEHNFERIVGVDKAQSAVLGLLMLRGPQTAGELRISVERWHRFADIGAVEAVLAALQEMTETRGVQLVVRLPRAPGAREQRWAHCLCGLPAESRDDTPETGAGDGQAAWTGPTAEASDPLQHEALALRLTACLARIDALEERVRCLENAGLSMTGTPDVGDPGPDRAV